MSYKVYMHTFPNGKKYVGITKQDVKRRWRNGKAYCQNIRMTNAIKKYGWDNIQHDVLAENLTEEQAAEIEIFLIKELDLLNPKKGYNLAEGGSHPNHTDETKRKIGEKNKGRKHTEQFRQWISEKNSGSNNFMYGKHHSEETKRKISEAKKGTASPNKGKFGSDHPCSRSVVAREPDTGKEIVFGSIIDAATFINRCPSGIQAVLHGKQKVCGGYMWQYV